MAATDVTSSIVAASRSGAVSATFAADAANGNKFFNDGRTILEVINGGTGALTVTLTEQQLVDGVQTAGKVITVAAGTTSEIGPFPTNVYNDANGFVTLAWSTATSVTARLTRVQ